MTRRLRVLYAIATLVIAFPAHAELPRELRVITYNIHHGEGTDGKIDLPRVAKVLLTERPDMVALQEVDQNTRRCGGVDQPAELARLTSMSVVFGQNIDYDGGGYGTAVLTRIPIRSSESVKLKSFYTTTPQHAEQRAVQLIELGEPDSPPLLFLCTHLDYRAKDGERFNSAVSINELMRKRGDTPAIIAGDFNARPESRVIREFAKEWKIVGRDGENIDPQAALLTFPASKPNRWLDYVMVHPANHWHVVESRVLEEPVASDHRPVLAVLRRAL